MISEEVLESAILELLTRAARVLPDDVKRAYVEWREHAGSEIARVHLDAIIENWKIAEAKCVPVCSDTGLPMVYAAVGERSAAGGGLSGLKRAAVRAVARGTESIPLRPNVVDPFTRENSRNNVGVLVPVMHIEIDPLLEGVEITVICKGGGGEAGTRFRRLWPAHGLAGLKSYILEEVAILDQRGQTCPPSVLGIGIGGTSELTMALAKMAAVLRPVGDRHPEGRIARLEEELLEGINLLETGPMGMGGKPSVLDVHIEYASTHLASLPVALAFQCGANRRATAFIGQDGSVEPRGYAQAWISMMRERSGICRTPGN